MAKLTTMQKLFVSEYLKDLNATQAAIRAGYSKKTADKQGTQLLGKTGIAEAIQEAMRSREARTLITQDRVVAELAKIAFSDASEVSRVVTKMDPNTLEDYQTVEIKDTEELSESQKACLAQIKQGKHGIEVAQYDKMKALELLGRHLGMFDRKDPVPDDTADDGFLDALKGSGDDAWQD